MEDLIFNVADSNFFFNDLEECDQVSLFEKKRNDDIYLQWYLLDILDII